jgi:hypothetical protein
MKAGITEPEETAVTRHWLCKHFSTATKSCDRGKDYARNDSGPVGGGVLWWVRAEAISGEGQSESEIVVRQSLPGGDVGAEAEESPLLEAVTYQRLLKTNEATSSEAVDN